MTATYNGSKVDFTWAQVHGSTFNSGRIKFYEVNIYLGWYSRHYYLKDSLNGSIEMG
jgi:hypothetical protein